MSFAVGSLVRARGREWVVLPRSASDLLVVRPLGGTDDEITGLYLPLEPVEPAQFALPDPELPGDYRSSRLLRDAVRLGFRSSAGPFRSFGSIAVEPRPYQLVPLLMALKLDPVRLLIADDVGIGKTVEAALIARELLDRAEVNRIAILCPPHLTAQWQSELAEKFHIQAEQVLPGTVTRLERQCGPGESIFDHFEHVIVSTDFVKSDRRRDDFLRLAPELVIVDEAHTCVASGEARGSRHQRYELVSKLAANRARHLILVTATPHSGKEEAFRQLLGLLDPSFLDLPEDLSGERNRRERERLAAQLVQRRRGHIVKYMGANTTFPTRSEEERTYTLSPAYQELFEEALQYARERVGEGLEGDYRQRLRWWSVLALLRALASSPAAAADTLNARSANAADQEEAQLDLDAVELLPQSMLDPVDDTSADGLDVVPSTDMGNEGRPDTSHKRRLAAMADKAAVLQGEADAKLQGVVKIVNNLLKEDYKPILFCRFIPTAEYVAKELQARVPKDVVVEAITSTLPAIDREQRVLQLAQAERRVLVCTDCLSEGLNLQEHFNAVVHYDLSWNPTRHEQREGRVDRYGQPSKQVKLVTYYGKDNQIDGIVWEVLVRKSKTIRSSLGISIPLPADATQVVQAVFEGLRLRQKPAAGPQQLMLFPQIQTERKIADLHRMWEAAADREKRSFALFAQESIRPDEVAREMDAVRAAIGAGVDVAGFVEAALRAHDAVVAPRDGAIKIDLTSTPRALREVLEAPANTFSARFEPPVGDKELYLQRTHPFVEALASYTFDTALDPLHKAVARRAGLIVTSKVERRTTLLLVRFRYHVIIKRGDTERPLLAEDLGLMAFAGSPQNATWLSSEQAETLLAATPEADRDDDDKRRFLRKIIEGFDAIRPHLNAEANRRGDELLAAHRRVRDAAKARGSYRIEAQRSPDVLGLYMYLPL
jgi:superfamily II DNA or RNA helicase